MLSSGVRQLTRLRGISKTLHPKAPSLYFSTEGSDDDSLKLSQPKKRPLTQEKIDVKDVQGNLVEAAQGVAEHLNQSDPLGKRNTSNALLQRLKKISAETKETKSSGGELSSLYSSLSVTSDKPKESLPKRGKSESNLTDEQKEFLERRRVRRRESREGGSKALPSSYKAGDLFGAKPLGIFGPGFVEKSEAQELKTWEACLQRDLDILLSPRPKNFLEEMVVMTDKGMLWQLPLDNEFGIKEDELEPFHQHVFLEKHLEPWCPKTGPIRHFMELVTVGLSKNPHMSIDKKIGHIKWFGEYLTAPDKQEIFNIMEAESAGEIPSSTS
eukprot:TRINITY_DN3533_c0_g1_i1.p1 TRINITY_DN3533_c0_g1~~TRINITY_DN3533_c0_g1_i1.p1  ORF type:complete len:327 (-),score=83.90 TRINITY_DN3533_c0_g1_i1:52-1032(-)